MPDNVVYRHVAGRFFVSERHTNATSLGHAKEPNRRTNTISECMPINAGDETRPVDC
jgi:hypothetical protein